MKTTTDNCRFCGDDIENTPNGWRLVSAEQENWGLRCPCNPNMVKEHRPNRTECIPGVN